MAKTFLVDFGDLQYGHTEDFDLADNQLLLLGVTFEPWEMAWLERSGVDIADWIRSAIHARFEVHGLDFSRWIDAPESCDLCAEPWNYRAIDTQPAILRLESGYYLPVWAIGASVFLHGECHAELVSAIRPENTSNDQLAFAKEVVDRLIANLASRMGIEQG